MDTEGTGKAGNRRLLLVGAVRPQCEDQTLGKSGVGPLPTRHQLREGSSSDWSSPTFPPTKSPRPPLQTAMTATNIVGEARTNLSRHDGPWGNWDKIARGLGINAGKGDSGVPG